MVESNSAESLEIHDNLENGVKEPTLQESINAIIQTNYYFNAIIVIFFPLGMLAHLFHWSDGLTFMLNFIAIVGLAKMLDLCTDELSKRLGQTIGALVNASFGNAVELVRNFKLLNLLDCWNIGIKGRASSGGTIFNSWKSIIKHAIRGLKFKTQKFNLEAANVNCSILMLGMIGFLLPAAFSIQETDKERLLVHELSFSRGTSVCLLIIYIGFMVFQLHTHKAMFCSSDDTEEEEHVRHLSFPVIIVSFVITTVLIALSAESLVGSIEGLSKSWGLSEAFIGLILIPIVGNAAEHVSAISAAMRNKMDLAIGVALGSTLQVSIFVTPLLVIIAWIMNVPLTLSFPVFDVAKLMNKKQKVEIDVGFNEKLRSDEITEPFSSAFTTATSYSSPDAQVFANPFRGGVLYNMFSSKFINSLETQVLEEEFYHKSNDLYEFYQSEDLKISKKPALVALRETIYSPQFVQWMSKLTGFTLSSTIDLSAHRYPQFGHLLCHDDDIGSENDGRRIAFIIYLVDPKWSEVDGGCLQLYDSWFHGPKPEVPNPLKLKPDLSNPLLLKWVNSAYLNEKNLSFISSKFEKESFVQLQKFLKPEMYTKLYESMKANTFSNITGTANAYRYHTLSGITKADDKTYEIIHSFRTFLESTVFHYLLSSITGLKLKTSPVTSTVRSFSPLDYTLMNDNFIEQSGIDVIFAFPVDLNGKNNECEWEDAWGGLTQYVADTQTLLSVSPIHNTLQLVDRDTETLRFVKLLNPSAVCARREFSLVYIEDEE
ncbi:hypothetical protein HDV02_000558 [Globomyces sp. JEL0801]|nr:hypothetical protein HDV02_000558 [Globomyces sp. JEL0801]